MKMNKNGWVQNFGTARSHQLMVSSAGVGLSCTVGHNYSRLFMTRDKIQMLRPNVATKNEQQAFLGLKYHFLLSLHIPTPFLQVANLALHPFFWVRKNHFHDPKSGRRYKEFLPTIKHFVTIVGDISHSWLFKWDISPTMISFHHRPFPKNHWIPTRTEDQARRIPSLPDIKHPPIFLPVFIVISGSSFEKKAT